MTDCIIHLFKILKGENEMFKINDVVMRGISGICTIVDIREENFRGKPEMYYVMQPIYERTTIFCPVESDKLKVRKLLTREEIEELIKTMPEQKNIWIENDSERKEKFNAIIKRGDHRELICLLKTLHRKREEKKELGKKFHIADERAMKEAEQLLHGEFAYVLGIGEEEVLPYILGKLN